jgi:hypothetical protein
MAMLLAVALLFWPIKTRMDKRFITFEAVAGAIDIEIEQSNVQPISACIVDVSAKVGAEVLGAPSEWDSYGWYADFQVGAAKLTCIMQRSDSWLLSFLSSGASWIGSKRGNTKPSLLSFREC